MFALYDAVRWLFFVAPPLVVPFQFFIDAPFGRFSPSTDSIFLVECIPAWIVMELVSPIAFLYAFTNTPLVTSSVNTQTLVPAQLLLAGLFLIHYANRAIISPLRTPSRSKAHISIPIGGIFFNVVNGTLMGAYLRSDHASTFLADAFTQPIFFAGIALWVLGCAGNILHDEILLNIRRDAKAKGKAKARSDDGDNGTHKKLEEHYGIPYGYLYAYISYPNYFCEWVEWTGFALAAASVPSLASFGALASTIQPPWIFVTSEMSFMLPRAYRGHRWYLEKFPDYPKERRAVIPYVF